MRLRFKVQHGPSSTPAKSIKESRRPRTVRGRTEVRYMAYDLLGKNFTPPDIHGKVTGKAKYAEDFRAEGMTFCRLLLSPMPHARVRNIDTKEALAMPGVFGILTADEVPAQPQPGDQILTNEPMFVGQPILAVAAVDETTAQDA